MKKCLIVLITLTLALLPMYAMAAKSREFPDPVNPEIIEIVPEDEEEEVVPPTIEIITDTPEVEELQEELKTIYRLTIYYVYTDGRTAAPTYSEVLQGGTEYSVPSPEIEGYTPSIRVVSGVMPMRDVEYTVVYFSPKDDTPAFPYSEMPEITGLTDYETPTGLGFSVSNVGICFE